MNRPFYRVIQESIEFLQSNQCARDSHSGLWMTATGEALASDPVESAKRLRSRMIRDHIEAERAAGRYMTRELIPQGTR